MAWKDIGKPVNPCFFSTISFSLGVNTFSASWSCSISNVSSKAASGEIILSSGIRFITSVSSLSLLTGLLREVIDGPSCRSSVILSGARFNSSARSLSGLWKADVNYAKFPLFRINWEKAHQQQIYRN